MASKTQVPEKEAASKQYKKWSVQQKQDIVLAFLGGKQTVAELANIHAVSEQLIYRWKLTFLAAGCQALNGVKAVTNKTDDALIQENRQFKILIGKKIDELFQENTQLKILLGEKVLEVATLRK